MAMMSMKKNRGGKNRLMHIVVFVLAIVLALLVLGFLPISSEVKKLLFFALIIVFSIVGVFVSNLLKRK